MDGWMDEPSELPNTIPLDGSTVAKVRIGVLSPYGPVCALTTQEQLLCWGAAGGLPYAGVFGLAPGGEPGTTASGTVLSFPPTSFGSVMGAPGSYCTIETQCLSGSCVAESCTGP